MTVTWDTVNAAAAGVFLVLPAENYFRGDGGPRGSVTFPIPCNGTKQTLFVKASREPNNTSATGPAFFLSVNESLEGT